MTKKLRIVLAQLNLTVGDLAGNLKKHIDAANKARDELAADIIVFPELGLTGYSPEDLLLRPSFIADTQASLNKFIDAAKGVHCLVSHPLKTATGLYNACSMIYDGKILGCYSKQFLPNYNVFDEYRYFDADNKACVIPINGVPIGLVICEDVWMPGPTREAVQQGARLILSPNASPFETTKFDQRLTVLANRAKENNIPIVYVNCVGGQDEIVFDGGSVVVDQTGVPRACAGFFKEALLPVDFTIEAATVHIDEQPFKSLSDLEKIYQALVLALRDYVEKNNIPNVFIGISGGIDSALTLAIAVDALGKDRVHAVLMPSRYTSAMSMEDANAIIQNFAITHETISIEPVFESFLTTLLPSFQGKKPDITEENIQARARAVILMALSNKYGGIVLTTGNRSELAVGYCSLYGDMAGGFAVLKDIPKTTVYELSKYRNRLKQVIPQRIIDRPPTAELAANQKDQDSLPPYDVLDQILDAYLNQSMSSNEIIALGFSRDTVTKVIKLVQQSEYKRRQSVVGPRVDHKSFGKDWRYPLTNKYRG